MILETVQRLLESADRPLLLGLLGQKRERACQRDMATYFRWLGAELPVDSLAALAKADHKEAALHQAEIQIRRSLRKLQPALLGLVSSHMMLAWKLGYETTKELEVKEAAIKPKGSPMDKLGEYGQRAADYAATQSATLVKGLNETTLTGLQDLISEGIEERWGVGGLAKQIRDFISEMEGDRARMIATTEMNRAMSTAALEKLSDLGIEYKRWVPVEDPCEYCEGNADDGPIPVDEEFSSGDDSPPQHPNCRCAVVGARAPEDDE